MSLPKNLYEVTTELYFPTPSSSSDMRGKIVALDTQRRLIPRSPTMAARPS